MSIQSLMRDIVKLDIQPDVFKVFLMATDHTTGFDAFVNFRSNYTNPNNVSSISVHADTVEEALENLKQELVYRFGKCEQCGNYFRR